jgi:outer membrane protein assembly factor BamD
MLSRNHVQPVTCATTSGRWRRRLGGGVAALALALAGGGVMQLGACAHAGAGVVTYQDSPQENYDAGVEQLERKEWVAAAKYFAFIKRQFQFSRYAVLAELRTADAEFGAGEYLQAVERYRLFIKLHPTHEHVIDGYASFKIGEAFYRQLPGDVWILPPAYEKDQGSTEDAGEELARFLDRYPDSPYRGEAQKIMARVARRLAEHEWYVARYYWDRDKPMGTVIRLRRLLERYRGVGFDEESLWLLGRAYAETKFPDKARATWTELVEKYPQHARAREAAGALQRLPAGAAPVAPPPPAPVTPPAPTPTPAPT